MIIPNLLVADIARSVAVYRDVVGLDVMMTLAADLQMGHGGEVIEGAVFATLGHAGAQLMLQTAAQTDDVLKPEKRPVRSWVYIRDLDPAPVARRAGTALLNGPELTWYGMKEIHLEDPDGHLVCVGKPEGTAHRPA